jgi:putative transposase
VVPLSLDKYNIIHFNVTRHPTACWTAHRMTAAFPYDSKPKYTIRDRDKIYGKVFIDRMKAMDIDEVLIAPRSPWQNPFAERVIGSIRRECLNHFIIFNERHLYQVLGSYVEYYNNARTHLSLDRNSPVPRTTELPSQGKVVSIAQVGGLHHQYKRVA